MRIINSCKVCINIIYTSLVLPI
ncbi:hypothetical protein E2C01_001291 [Portunus trituberculatus]|uniref:Uncharacterized protein n=1 Tax=Portunus trituberculatus TaxID=210409 RepID=A0A5B7CGT0_PORTR|nr:hypothetical protein [Portunus trituberculatus]